MKIVSSIITTSLDKNTDEPCIFIGFKIVKKIAKASVRNKIRRRIKAIIRTIIKSEGYVHANQAFIIIPRTGILQKKYSDLEMEIGSAFKFLNKKIIDLNK
jgi:ribonuclease P protein component